MREIFYSTVLRTVVSSMQEHLSPSYTSRVMWFRIMASTTVQRTIARSIVYNYMSGQV